MDTREAELTVGVGAREGVDSRQAGEAWEDRLRAGGFRLTPQRELVLQAVSRLGHATPEDVAAEIAGQVGAISLSTVYRALEVLEQVGLVTHAHLGHGAPTYHPADRAGHVHLVCRKCQQVAEVDLAVAEDLVRRLQDDYGFATDMAHFALFGTCRQCAASEREGLPS